MLFFPLQKPADDVNILKTIRKSFRLKKKVQLDPQQQGKVSGADHTYPSTPMERRWTTSDRSSPSTGKKRSSAYVPIRYITCADQYTRYYTHTVLSLVLNLIM